MTLVAFVACMHVFVLASLFALLGMARALTRMSTQPKTRLEG
jgi:hypothetical protein